MLPSSGKPLNQIFLYTLQQFLLYLLFIVFTFYSFWMSLPLLNYMLKTDADFWLSTSSLMWPPTQNSSLQSMCSRVWQMLYSLCPPPPPSTHSPQCFVFQKFQYSSRLSVSRLISDWWIRSFIVGIFVHFWDWFLLVYPLKWPMFYFSLTHKFWFRSICIDNWQNLSIYNSFLKTSKSFPSLDMLSFK